MSSDAWQCPRCGATSGLEMDTKCSADLLDMCPGFVAVELGLYPDGRNCPRESLAPDSRAIYDQLVRKETTND